MTTIAVDFDGVIHGYSKGWQDGSIYDPPLPGALEALDKLMTKYAVFIFTSRNTTQTAEWLTLRGFITTTDDSEFEHNLTWNGKFWDKQGILLVTNRKLGAAAYIDDRGIRFETWSKALRDIERYVK